MRRIPAVVPYLLGVAAILAISLVIFYLLMKPPISELGLMTLFLLTTALVSSLAGYAAYKLGWIALAPSLHITLLIIYALSSLLTFFNVWFSAQMMFASQHDLLLSIVLLVFAGGMAMALGYFLSSTITDRVYSLNDAARKLAKGDLGARVPVSGRDEIAALAETFNQMALQLQAADQKQRELEQLRNDLLAWVGHDLQTPLASIRAILEALADRMIDDPEQVQRYLLTAQRDVRSLSALIVDLSQMAQLDAGGIPLDLAEGSLSDLISDTLESFSELANRQDILLGGKAKANVDPVIMDTQRIGRVLNNLVANALRHTPAKGTVEVYSWREADAVFVSVSDTGEGIPPKDLQHVFDRFYRGEKSRSRATGGAGLGLAIARGIVQAHGGEIQVESKEGQGTTFTFRLPVSRP